MATEPTVRTGRTEGSVSGSSLENPQLSGRFGDRTPTASPHHEGRKANSA
ncbi:hypothetical protein C791_7334 [Amycolatopsis azurea DSM 43854]|uniref:Uncharacterized protein n=1 Tax=Amycolatopsis azurea DSM 43854 TaxID=1238180 RepID=M2NME8_9PSEU|nr:hypothetical protein C791_7334 [Amycolatopsis azurea DSM 43854]